MNIRFLEIASIELEDAVGYYNAESPGLGYEFADEVMCTIRRISRTIFLQYSYVARSSGRSAISRRRLPSIMMRSDSLESSFDSWSIATCSSGNAK